MKKEESISPKRTRKGKQFIAEEVSVGSKTTVHTTTRKTSAKRCMFCRQVIDWSVQDENN